MGRHSGRATPSLHDTPHRQIEEATGRRSTYPLPILLQTNRATSAPARWLSNRNGLPGEAPWQHNQRVKGDAGGGQGQYGGCKGSDGVSSVSPSLPAALANSNTPHPSPAPLPGDGGRWYVAQVLSQKEGYAAEHLARQGFQTFCPRFYRAPSRTAKRGAVLAPLFPGYIFVNFDIKVDRWLAVNSTRGVIRLVGPRLSAPSAVSAVVIGLIMSRCSAGILTKLPEYIRAGDRIQINAGPLAGQIAEIESFDDRGRVKVLLSMLGAAHSVSVSADQLAAVAAA